MHRLFWAPTFPWSSCLVRLSVLLAQTGQCAVRVFKLLVGWLASLMFDQ